MRRTQAAIFAAPRTIEVRERSIREPGADEVRVRLEGCGVCASNLPVWEGRSWFHYPLAPGVPGHEGWGRVEAVGTSVKDVHEGDRVAFLSSNAYAKHDVARAADVVVLPEHLDDQPFPGEPLGCVMNILARAEVHAGQTVAVVGVGFLGAALVALLVRRGARVIALSRRAWARGVAEQEGAHATFPLSTEGLRDAQAWVGPTGCERVIEAVGTQEALDVATALTGTRGKLVIAGYHQDGPRTVDMQLWNWRGIDVINAHEREPARYREGIEAAVAAVISGQLDPRPLYTHTVPLDQLDRAFALLSERPEGFLKALVTWP